MKRRFFKLGTLGLGAAAAILAAQDAPPLEVPIVQVNDSPTRAPAEVSIAINPLNPDNIVGASLARGVNRTYFSRDGGLTWTTVPAANPDNRRQGDDSVTFDAQGRAYHSYISFEGLRQQRPKRAANGIFVRRSDDGGAQWSEPVAVVDHINTLAPFEDKPYLAADTVEASPSYGNIYIAWTRFEEYGVPDPDCRSRILFSRSTDGAATFAVPIVVSDGFGDCRDSDDTVEGAVPAVGPQGTVYLAWAGPVGLVFDKSSDGGLTFGTDRVIADNPQGWDLPLPGMPRHNGLPVTGVDLSPGPFRGTIYLNWIDARFGDADVFLIYSRDGGDAWSPPARVNDDPQGNQRHQLFTWMAVDPLDGSVNIVFYDRRRQEGDANGLTLARSVDGGQSFVNHEIPIEPFEVQARTFFGDYIGIAARGGLTVPFFTHSAGRRALKVSAALCRFEPGTQTLFGTTKPAGR